MGNPKYKVRIFPRAEKDLLEIKEYFNQTLGISADNFISVDNYLIFYLIEEETVQIHRFLYGKRDYSSII